MIESLNLQWKVGIGRADITPSEPIAMAGWARRRISEDIVHPLHAKALALQDARGQTGVLVTMDLLGLSRATSEELAARASEKLGLSREQLIVNSSHSHAGPVTGDLLHLYDLSAADIEGINRYAKELLDKIESCIKAALDSLEPNTLHFEQGLCGFGTNRRRDQRSRPEYSDARALPQVVDHDAPVLCVKDRDEKLRAVVFGYACHPTSYAKPNLCGDWPGFTQIEIEKQFTDCTAMFVAGCGADINPLPRFGRYHEQLSETFGLLLAASVCNVLDDPMRPIESSLSMSFEEIHLPLQEPPTLPELKAMREAALKKYGGGLRVQEVERQIQKLERGETLATSAPLPLHVWKIGALDFIALSGEPVVDYSLNGKNLYGHDSVWVAGYCNEQTAYIPSRRVLREGGYEGCDAMMQSDWPAPFEENVEDVIMATIDDLMRHNEDTTKD